MISFPPGLQMIVVKIKFNWNLEFERSNLTCYIHHNASRGTLMNGVTVLFFQNDLIITMITICPMIPIILIFPVLPIFPTIPVFLMIWTISLVETPNLKCYNIRINNLLTPLDGQPGKKIGWKIFMKATYCVHCSILCLLFALPLTIVNIKSR